MKLGVETIIVRQTMSDEFGIYRTTDSRHEFLMLPFSTKEEALNIGSKIAGLLNVPFLSYLPHEDEKEKNSLEKIQQPTYNSDMARFKKKQQVRGVGLMCQQLLGQSKTVEEIIEIILPRYINVGRSEADGRSNIKWYIREATKLINT